MSDVSLGPTPIPELTHIMIGLESCSFLVCTCDICLLFASEQHPDVSLHLYVFFCFFKGGRFHPLCSAEYDDGWRWIIFCRWTGERHVHPPVS